jgi:hypothetical protein
MPTFLAGRPDVDQHAADDLGGAVGAVQDHRQYFRQFRVGLMILQSHLPHTDDGLQQAVEFMGEPAGHLELPASEIPPDAVVHHRPEDQHVNLTDRENICRGPWA